MSAPAAPAVVSLDDADRALLAALDADPTAGFQTLGERVGVSAHTAARRYERLRRTGVVRVLGRTLPGFAGRPVWLVRAQAGPATVVPLAEELAGRAATRWVRVSRDRTELTCGLLGSDTERDDAMDMLAAAALPGTLMTHQILRAWGAEGTSTIPPAGLDRTDQRLLTLLEPDGRLSSTQLAAQLGIDASTVSRRRRRLIDSGVLYFEADIHPGALGGYGDSLVWFTVAPGRVRALGDALHAAQESRFVAATSGSRALVANLIVPQLTDLVDFVDGLQDYGITQAEIVTMGRVLKRTL